MDKTEQILALSWLKNGIWALALAGLYSIVLVVLRTPQLAHLFDDKSLFKSSLIIHVDLSVLVWLLSIACIIWSYGTKRSYFEKIFNKLAFAGMILMAISPMISSSNPIMNNYVPILENIWFIIGLSLFGCAVLCFAILVFINSFWDFKRSDHVANILPIVKMTSSLIYIMVWVCFILSYREVMELSSVFPIDIEYYYELLFWSGGHLMQFIYTQIVMFVWLILAELWIKKELHYYKIYSHLFIVNFILSMFIFYGHFAYQMSEYEFTDFFTKHMQYTGGIVPVLFILVLIVDCHVILRTPRNDVQHKFIGTSFLASTFLFFVGGLMGILISGVNVSIPAHYHGSIVGISIAFLGFAYIFCFQNFIQINEKTLSAELFSARIEVESINTKWANVQLYLITIGQLLHISGLALAGGYGILRKNPDGIIAPSAKIYMGMVGIGGLIAIIGGLMFVYISARMLYSFRRYKI